MNTENAPQSPRKPGSGDATYGSSPADSSAGNPAVGSHTSDTGAESARQAPNYRSVPLSKKLEGNSPDSPNEEDEPTRADLVSYDDNGLGRQAARGEPTANDRKTTVIAHDLKDGAKWSGVFILIVAGIALALYLLHFIWVGLLPVILSILVASVLYPVSAWLRRHKFPRALAAITTLLGAFLLATGIFTAMAPVVRNQGSDLVKQAEEGVRQLPDMLESLPFNIDTSQINQVINEGIQFLKNQSANIASGVISGVSLATSFFTTVFVMLIVTFFFLKDGDRFLPWMRKYTGSAIGWHGTELLNRIWKSLSGFIQAQAMVSLVDAFFIGLGLWILQVPLALVIAVVTFFAGFIPIIGAVSAGALAVIIALVTNGLTNALLALLLIILVQQLEGNILSPMLQSKAMGLHAAIILLSVMVGSTLAGIIGAFLAVPVAATIAVVLRYQAEMMSLRSAEIDPADIDIQTEGDINDDRTPRAKVHQLFHELHGVG